MWLEALGVTLSRLGIEVVYKATDAEDALRAVLRHEPALFVTALDFDSGETNALRCIGEVLDRRPSTKVVAMSRSGDAATIERALDAGASAYVLKSVQPDDFASAVRQVFEHTVHYASERRPAARSEPAEHDPHVGDDLTRRELEILRLVAQGDSNSEMARTLWVTEQTVKFHLSNVYRKLGVRNRTQASMWAQAHSVLPDRTADTAA